jgi:hypothetical protein
LTLAGTVSTIAPMYNKATGSPGYSLGRFLGQSFYVNGQPYATLSSDVVVPGDKVVCVLLASIIH